MARRLMRWGARVCVAPDETVAAALLPERAWGAILVDHAHRPRRLRRARARDGRGAAPLRAGDAGGAHRAARAEGGRLHRLSGQAGARGFARGADGRRRRRIRAARRQHRTPPSDARQRTRRKGLAILVAEDNEINALLARSLLTRLGHRPTIATNGDAAVDAWLVGARGRRALRDRADGRAHAGLRRHRGDAAHPRGRGRGGAAHADRRAHRQCVRRGPRRLPRRRAWTAS